MHGDPHPPGLTTAGHTARSRPAGGPGLRPARRLLGDKPGNRHAEGTEKEARAQRPAGRCATHAGLAARDRDVPAAAGRRDRNHAVRHRLRPDAMSQGPVSLQRHQLRPNATSRGPVSLQHSQMDPQALTWWHVGAGPSAEGGASDGLSAPLGSGDSTGPASLCSPAKQGPGRCRPGGAAGPLQTPGLLAPRPSTARPPQTSVHDVRNCLCCNKSLRCFCYSSPVF